MSAEDLVSGPAAYAAVLRRVWFTIRRMVECGDGCRHAVGALHRSIGRASAVGKSATMGHYGDTESRLSQGFCEQAAGVQRPRVRHGSGRCGVTSAGTVNQQFMGGGRACPVRVVGFGHPSERHGYLPFPGHELVYRSAMYHGAGRIRDARLCRIAQRTTLDASKSNIERAEIRAVLISTPERIPRRNRILSK